MTSTRRVGIARTFVTLSQVGFAIGVLALVVAVFLPSRADREDVLAIGSFGWMAWAIGCVVAILLARPDSCSKGHTDIGFYYGRWSCRTCYRAEKRKISQRARKRS